MRQPAGLTGDAPIVTLGPWSCCMQPPGAIRQPEQLRGALAGWLAAPVPGTVAAALQANQRWQLGEPLDADAHDWWYRTEFAAPELRTGESCWLCCDGLATLAQIWLNGELLLTTDNMFRPHRLNITRCLQPQNELLIAFRSLTEDLKRKRPRPRWKTRLVNHQQLRWRRTTLFGRIPGWSPPVPPVGPWRAVRLETGCLHVAELRLNTDLVGTTGVVTLHGSLEGTTRPDHAVLHVGSYQSPMALVPEGDGWRLRGVVRVPDAPLWWPHTHGTQPLLDYRLTIEAGGEQMSTTCRKIGFRRLEVQQDDGLEVCVNGVPVYCRGACWTLSDIATLDGTADALSRDLQLARAAGINMLRVVGSMIYESDRFYELCDELGILIWQDFMFANMDYPVQDEAFAANIEAEARGQLSRLAHHPCLAVYCGNSEVEQQAAMFGAPRELWRNEWFARRLSEICAEYHPGAGYVPSSPSGGVMPFHVGTGVAHYYGIGAYLRSPRELRQAGVKFAAECLAFANIPEPEAVSAIMDGDVPATHDPRWKQRVPRDTGAGWDFEDVRDHYLRERFGVDPVALRSCDMPRYLQLSRVVSGEMMALVFAEWRSGHSPNRGGLVWFFKDLWPAAGWGVVDSRGWPKAAYYYLRRSWQNRQIVLTDETLDGLHLHAINETATPLDGHVEVILLRDQHVVVARGESACRVSARSTQMFVAEELLGGFHDVGYVYRFGPPQHDLVIATLYDDRRAVLSEAFHFVPVREPAHLTDAEIAAQAVPIDKGRYCITLKANRFLQAVSLEAPGFLFEDNYFHLVPGREKSVDCAAWSEPARPFRATVTALNLRDAVLVVTGDPAEGRTS